MTPVERELAILDRVRASLIADGYDVIVQPQALDLPVFLKDLRPDAIAHRGVDHLVVEVVSRSERTERRLRELRAAIANQSGWQLQTVWTAPSTIPNSLQHVSFDAVSSALSEIDQLIASKHLRPAFLLAWAALESLGRTLLPLDFAKPQTPRRLIEYLGANGFIDRTDARRLRRLAEARNRLIHGELQSELGEDDLIEIRDILWKLREMVRQN
jgi:uncharacterized protein YutE (UPF0331/DUF86 family)